MELKSLLEEIVKHNKLHAKWLNTLSFMENAGARKISACEHFAQVDLIQLKHAAEEHRHAYYLKKQISKLDVGICKTYLNNELLASTATRQYLHRLDIKVCKYLQQTLNICKEELKFAAYLFVTYIIELRADHIYPIYQEVLYRAMSKIMVKSIILEEEGHLEEMTVQLNGFCDDWQRHIEVLLPAEEELYRRWVNAVSNQVFYHD